MDYRDTHSSGRAKNPHITPTSKMAARLEESPDVLQTDSSTTKLKRLFLAPSKSPPLSRPPGVSFHLERFIVPGLLEAKNCEIELDKATKACYVRYTEPDLMQDAITKVSFDKIRTMFFSGENKGSSLVRLGLSAGVYFVNQCFLDFGDSEKTYAEFTTLLQKLIPGINAIIKEE